MQKVLDLLFLHFVNPPHPHPLLVNNDQSLTFNLLQTMVRFSSVDKKVLQGRKNQPAVIFSMQVTLNPNLWQ